jgi:hypothetical protein
MMDAKVFHAKSRTVVYNEKQGDEDADGPREEPRKSSAHKGNASAHDSAPSYAAAAADDGALISPLSESDEDEVGSTGGQLTPNIGCSIYVHPLPQPPLSSLQQIIQGCCREEHWSEQHATAEEERQLQCHQYEQQQMQQPKFEVGQTVLAMWGDDWINAKIMHIASYLYHENGEGGMQFVVAEPHLRHVTWTVAANEVRALPRPSPPVDRKEEEEEEEVVVVVVAVEEGMVVEQEQRQSSVMPMLYPNPVSTPHDLIAHDSGCDGPAQGTPAAPTAQGATSAVSAAQGALPSAASTAVWSPMSDVDDDDCESDLVDALTGTADQCPICLDSLTDHAHQLPICKHQLCYPCLENFLAFEATNVQRVNRRGIVVVCPVCRCKQRVELFSAEVLL